MNKNLIQTKSYFLQVLLAGVEDIKIAECIEGDDGSCTITYEYNLEQENDVVWIQYCFDNGYYINKKIDNIDELKKTRRKLINKYKNR